MKNKHDVKSEKYLKELVGYTMLHRWVRGLKGRPKKCEYCGKKNKTKGRSCIEWATKSGNYTRFLNDWISLCRSCHMKFDHIDRKKTQTELWKNPKYRAKMVKAHKHLKYKHNEKIN